MRIVLFILFAFFISCQKQKGISKPETSIQEKTKLIAARTTDKLLKTDTVFVYDSGEFNDPECAQSNQRVYQGFSHCE